MRNAEKNGVKGVRKMIKEVFEKNREIVTYENEKIDLGLFKKRSSAKTFRGWLLGKFKKAIKEENLEVAMILQTIYKKYEEFEKEKKSLIELEIVDGWKGKGDLEIWGGF